MNQKNRSLFFISLALFSIFAAFAVSCTPNNPYRSSDKKANIYYTTFSEPPKHLDPARSYSSNEYDFLGQIYEPLVQYHYLKRPYELIPLAGASVPSPLYYGVNGNPLPKDALPETVHRAVYEIEIQENIMYQPHPAFAKDSAGAPLYNSLNSSDLTKIDEVRDFKVQGSRALTSEDYIFQIKRLADPRVQSPILPILEKYILGLSEFSKALRDDLSRIRSERKAAGGATYSQVMDERTNPIILDYDKFPFPGAISDGPQNFKIILKQKYPQFVYWLAMPFFSPIPKEAIDFYNQSVLTEKNITLDRFPVGTGPFMIDTYNPNLEIVLKKNPNFHFEPYPSIGEAGDREAGLLYDAGEALPFLDQIVFKLEKESIPRWNKFLQGYFDASGIASDSFDSAVTLGAEGGAELTDFIKNKGIRLMTSVRPSIYYMGFNMLDDVVGGYTNETVKLRQAISIVLDYEEYIEIFNNGRGIPASGPLPPGIFGHTEGRAGMNRYIYDWDSENKRPVRKSVKEAKRLMAEAGYKDGRDKEGRPLIISFDNPWTGVDAQAMIGWYIKKFKLLGIQLENRTTDYNRFQEKMHKGNFQFFGWGWNADYPDPENFFFLLAGQNGKVKHKGENAVNYENPEFDRLFKVMENMDSTPERLKIIQEMTGIVRSDSPWVWGFYPVSFGLQHQWVKNIKSNSMANNTMKYMRINTQTRAEKRDSWNRPRLLPIIALVILFILVSIPAVITIRKRMNK
jgi:ABC-type transport system substrate-binding protein